MDPSLSDFVLDPSRCCELSIDGKRELIYELTKRNQGASDMLQSWTRKDILEVLCVEMGKERKYTSVAKYKLIELLLKIISEKIPGNQTEETHSISRPSSSAISYKKPRKADHPCRLPVRTCIFPSNQDYSDESLNSPVICQNTVCRAKLSRDDKFCKRCSCCICCKFDDNKDPSLWLVCSPDDPSIDDSCGMTCHVECALLNEKTAIMEGKHDSTVDGSFYCPSCRKMNSMLGCWKKQLLLAKEARCVDALCYRISLAHKLLDGTEKYQKSHEIVDMVMKKLESEVGSLNQLPSSMARRIANSLSCVTEIQNLCLLAIEALETLPFSVHHLVPESECIKTGFELSKLITFEKVSSNSLTVVMGAKDCSSFHEQVTSYSIWHRRADVSFYQTDPTFKSVNLGAKISMAALTAGTEYFFKVVAFYNEIELGCYELCVKTRNNEDNLMENAMERKSTPRACGSPKTNIIDVSNPSEVIESTNNNSMSKDFNGLPDDDIGQSMKTEDPEVNKYSDCQETLNVKEIHSGMKTRDIQTPAPAETPGCSVSSLDEEPDITIQAVGRKDTKILASLIPAQTSENESLLHVEDNANTLSDEKRTSVLPIMSLNSEAINEMTGKSDEMIIGTDELDYWHPKPEKDARVESPSNKKSVGTGKKPTDTAELEEDYEYCVKVIRWLECGGHIGTNFRVKFLSWFSLRATSQEQRVVSVFIKTLIDDPPSLAGQLMDAFSDCICSNKRPANVPSGFCMKLWH